MINNQEKRMTHNICDRANEKWFPGKYLSKATKKKSTSSQDDHVIDDHRVILSGTPRERDARENIPAGMGNYSTRGELEIIGAVEVCVLEVKYSRVLRPAAHIQVGPERQPFEISNESQCRIFSVYEIDTDINIIIRSSDADEKRGASTYAVVIPICSLLDTFGNVKKGSSQPQWRQLLLTSPNHRTSSGEVKFTAAYAEGCGMIREKYAAGFIRFAVKLKLNKNCYWLYLYPRALQYQGANSHPLSKVITLVSAFFFSFLFI